RSKESTRHIVYGMGKNDGGECDLLETHGIAARLPARLCLGIFRIKNSPFPGLPPPHGQPTGANGNRTNAGKRFGKQIKSGGRPRKSPVRPAGRNPERWLREEGKES
ncbi:MAG: hypothetical protein VCF07_18695, partial [Nitrospinota bacterium]